MTCESPLGTQLSPPLKMMIPRLAFLLLVSVEAKVVDFRSANAKAAGNLKDLRFVSRFMVPYGPDIFGDGNSPQSPDDRPYRGYGFGMVSSTRRKHVPHSVTTDLIRGMLMTLFLTGCSRNHCVRHRESLFVHI